MNTMDITKNTDVKMETREIKFRGKSCLTVKWFYGFFATDYEYSYIYAYNSIFGKPLALNPYHVDPKTVGQFTSWKDKNGKEIYEGDIVDTIVLPTPCVVKWDMECAKFIIDLGAGDYYEFIDIDEIEVIGNRFENPELLEEE